MTLIETQVLTASGKTESKISVDISRIMELDLGSKRKSWMNPRMKSTMI